jgi:tetratricopeptide (TPR) repeat protein
MAPEQASGRPEEIGPPADVYGLGAVLYEMLTGRPPFKASNRLETLEQVRSLEPVAPRQLQPRVPRDLETICLKCLHKEPSKRYGSAKLLAEDLRRFSDKVPILARPVGLVERTWRWCRRKPAVAGLAAAVVLLLVGGTIASTFAAWQINKRAKAEKEANAKASRRLRDVLDATEQHFTTLAMNKELKAEGLETLRQKLLEGARDFCERYAKEESDDPEVRYQQARAYANLATIATELGHLDEAERAFHQAVPLFQELSAAFPNDPSYQRRVGMLHGCQANIFADKGNPQGALAEYAAALQIFERLNEAYPQDTTYLFDLALCHEGRGNLLRHAASPKATIQAYQASLSFRQRIVDVSPDNLDYQRALASSHFNLGQMAMENGELSLAETEFKKDLEITARLARIEPAAPENQSGLVQTHGALGDVYQKMKVPVRAESAFKEAIRIGRELVQKHPLVPKYQTRLAVALFHFAHLYRQLNCLADEERLLREAYSVLEPLTAKHPSLVIERGLLGAVTCNLAGAVGDLNRLEEAVSWQDKSIAVFEALLQAAPEDPGSRDYLMRATAGRALWTARLGRPDDAIKFMKRSLELDVKDSQIEILAAVAQKGAHQSVTAVADRLLGKPRLTPQYLFQLARVYGYATNAAEGDTTLSPTDRVACKRTYSEKALSLLQKAASAAPKHTASLVDAIRADSAFSKLLLQDDYREWLKKLQPNIK